MYYGDGYECRLQGVPLDFCPFRDTPIAITGDDGKRLVSDSRPGREWREGWRHADRVEEAKELTGKGLDPRNIDDRLKRLRIARGQPVLVRT